MTNSTIFYVNLKTKVLSTKLSVLSDETERTFIILLIDFVSVCLVLIVCWYFLVSLSEPPTFSLLSIFSFAVD